MVNSNLKMYKFLPTILFILILISNLKVHATPLVPCYFIFGDSLSDPGNNNALKTKAKVNYKPYGIDYPARRPTGRFTNGRTVVDIIAEHLGFKEHIAPYSTVNKNQILQGVNYASGSAGISRETGSHLGDHVSLEAQMGNHIKITRRLKATLNNTTNDYLTKCLYTINIGSNDYVNNYFLPKFYPTSRKYTPDYFAALLIQHYSKQLKTLHQYGARKVAVYGLGQIGCALAELAKRPNGVVKHPLLGPCVKEINDAVNMFNAKLKLLIPQLNRQLPNATFTIINTEAIFAGPGQGIKTVTKPCCKLREDYQCKEGIAPCNNRESYFFYDGFHPTEAVNKITGAIAFKASSNFEAFPYDISHLIKQ
ncbi:GDSL esterase/lipase At1g29670-like [Silene latifolia]|uniref:GDSL esterase/lipase At1g29670-like n=1 Tax=Silene latifolia TaxID=37657 RepID=UPI003D786BB8